MGNKKTNLVMKNSSILNCDDGIIFNGPFSGVVDNNSLIGCVSGIILKGGNTSQIMNN